MSHNYSQQKSEQGMGSMNPFLPALNALLSGQQMGTYRGGMTFQGHPGSGRNANEMRGILTPEHLQSIGSLFEASGLSGDQQAVLGGGLGQQALDLTQQGISNLSENVIPGLTQLASNDPSTFFDPAFASFSNSLENEIFPSIREGFGPDQFTTDIAGMQSDAATQGLLDITLGSTEQAAQFATQAAPILAAIQQSMGMAPLEVGSGVLGLADQARTTERMSTQGGAVLETLLGIAGMPAIGGMGSYGSSAGQAMGFDAKCWCAAVHFGWFSSDWFAARHWILEEWPKQSVLGAIFAELYTNRGADLADILKNSKELQDATRPFFEWAAEMGRK